MKNKLFRRFGALLLTLALALSLAAPAWAADPDPIIITRDDLGVTLAAVEWDWPGKIINGGGGTLSAGEGGTLVATISKPEDVPKGVKVSYTYEWESLTETVATVRVGNQNTDGTTASPVSSTASVTAKVAGTANIKITATATATWTEPVTVTSADGSTTTKDVEKTLIADGSAEFTVQVEPVLATTIALNGGTGFSETAGKYRMSLKVGGTSPLTAAVVPDTTTDKTVTWEIKNQQPTGSSPVITLSSTTGSTVTITAQNEGKAEITATTSNGKTTTCEVTVAAADVPVEGVELNPKELTVVATQTKSLTHTILPAGATNRSVIWTSSDNKVATVDNEGNVNGLKAGTATIKVTTRDGNYTDECKVTVTPADTTGITISSNMYGKESPLCLDIGKEPAKLIVAVNEGADKSVTWESGDEDIVTVDKDGTVRAVGVGRTTITATSDSNPEKSATCYVEVSGVALDEKSLPGTLYLNQNHPLKISTFGNAAKANAKKNWVSSNPGVAAVNSADEIVARGYGTAKLSVTYVVGNTIYEVQGSPFEVTVEEDDDTILKGNATAGAPYAFTNIMAELNSICQSQTGHALSYITNLNVPPKEGVLYYVHVSSEDTGFGVGATERYYYNSSTIGERLLDGLTFVPNSEFNGVTTITFTGYNTEGKSYYGKIRLTVTGSGNVTYITKSGEPVRFSSTSFSAACRSETGRDLNSASFQLPSAERGTLYYGYTGPGQYRYEVTEGEEYFRSRTPYLDQVSFVPAEYYIGTFRIPFDGVDTAGERFTGTLNIIVVPNRKDGERSELTVTVPRGTSVSFAKFDFNAVSRQLLGESLSYVRFTPPSSSAGTLYYKYTSASNYESLVNANTRYRQSSTPYISDLTFVPASGRIAPVTIDFEGYGASGKRFEGFVTIYYGENDSGDVITYAVSSGQAIPFEPADFNELCEGTTGEALNRIVFQYLPDSSVGTLYYNYDSGSSTGTKVTTKTNIYRSGSPRLSTVAFAPRSDFVGTVEMEFTGYNTSGGRFTGTVRIEVEEGNTTLRYSVPSGSSVSFNAADFNAVCKQATDGNLNYVRFQLPKSSQGTLYCRTSTNSTSKNTVSAGTSYYYSTSGSNRIDNVLFTAAKNYSGTVSIDFTGFSVSGARFTGTVDVSVAYHWSTTLDYTATSLPLTIPDSDLVSACESVLDRDLSYVLFTSLPKENQGRLYYDYAGYGTGTEVKTSTKYYNGKSPYLSRIVFVPKAGYSGTVSLPYTGYDTRGDSVSGVINITVTKPTVSKFNDMGGHTWAIPSVEFLNASGVVYGTGSSRYEPAGNVKRGDFVLMLYRMYHFGAAGTSSFSDVPVDSYYARAIASAKAQGVVTGENNRFYPEADITREDAMVFLRNAMRAAGMTVPTGSDSELYAFTDYNSISSNARSAMISMIHMGLLRGDDYRRLNPTNSISRAEMAALIHRAMTL